MTDRTLSMMEVHPQIIAMNRLRNSLRLACNMANQSYNRLHEQAKIFEGIMGRGVGTTVKIRMPQRIVG